MVKIINLGMNNNESGGIFLINLALAGPSTQSRQNASDFEIYEFIIENEICQNVPGMFVALIESLNHLG